MSDASAIETNHEHFAVEIGIPICKVEDEQRNVTGIVLEPNEVDAHNDFERPETIRQAAHSFLARFNKDTQLGLMHKVFGAIGVELVESFIAPVDFDLNGRAIKKGTWIMTVHVVSDSVWKDIKDGKITGFSIGGVATVAAQPQAAAA